MMRTRFQAFLAGASLALAVLLGQPGIALADAAGLQARHAEIAQALRDSPFGQPLVIESSQSPDTLQGEVNAVLDQPFARVREAFRDPPRWCDVMILPFNTKYCHAVQSEGDPALLVRIGRRYDQPVERAHQLRLDFHKVADSGEYFETRLQADQGPIGTRNYRMTLAAIPLPNNQTFLRLSYSYGYGTMSRVAMQVYLATSGADKIGFTRIPAPDGGEPQWIGGMRGAVERNVMRYYLAINAYLESLSAPPDQQAERRIQTWFDASERYPRQLHEMDRNTYLTMKRKEQERQQALLQ